MIRMMTAFFRAFYARFFPPPASASTTKVVCFEPERGREVSPMARLMLTRQPARVLRMEPRRRRAGFGRGLAFDGYSAIFRPYSS